MATSSTRKTIKVDLIFETLFEDEYPAAFYAVQSVALISQKIAEFPSLKPLTVLFKKLLYRNQLNAPFFGNSAIFLFYL